MKKFLLVLLTLFIAVNLPAHEEPAKTIKEKREKEQERLRIKKLGIKSSTVWQYILSSDETASKKYKYLVSEYNPDGTLHSLIQYDTAGIVVLKVKYDYDDQYNMITDADYDKNDKILEKIEYRYDNSGRVAGSLNYKGTKIDSRFEYKQNPGNNSVDFYKYDSQNKLEYRIDYVYTGNIDNGQLSEIYKCEVTGDTSMSVTYTYFPSGKVKEKFVFVQNKVLLHKFEYMWDDNGYRKEIKKILPGEKIGFIQQFKCDKNGNYLKVNVYDSGKKLTSKTEYEYTYY